MAHKKFEVLSNSDCTETTNLSNQRQQLQPEVSSVSNHSNDDSDKSFRPSSKRQRLQLEEVESVAETLTNSSNQRQQLQPEVSSVSNYSNDNSDKSFRPPSKRQRLQLEEVESVAETRVKCTEATKSYQYENALEKQQEIDDEAATDDETITASTCKESQQRAQSNNIFGDFFGAVNKIGVSSKGLNLKNTVEALKYLKEKYCIEYNVSRIGELACSFIASKIEDYLPLWNPLCQPTLPLSLFEEWKEVLKNESLYNDKLCTTLYDQFVWDCWMLSVQIAIQKWKCYQPENLVHLIKLWKNIIPSRILENILEMIFQKLKSTVEQEWNPVTDKLPIRTWIHPWLRFMHKKIVAEIYPIIHEKFGNIVVYCDSSVTKEDIEICYTEWHNLWNDKKLAESIIKEPPFKIVFYHSQEEDSKGSEMSRFEECHDGKSTIFRTSSLFAEYSSIRG